MLYFIHLCLFYSCFSFFFNDTATTEIYTLSLHDALPIFRHGDPGDPPSDAAIHGNNYYPAYPIGSIDPNVAARAGDRKSTRLNSSHANISYAVFCLKKKTKNKKCIKMILRKT